MDFIIKALTPELADTFTEYLAGLDFGHAPHWASCYCRYYYLDCPQNEWMTRSGAQNRDEAVQKIKEGAMRGYLAFDGDTCIGWCNANDARAFVRLEADICHLIKDKRVGCVICYVIHPDYRGKGVARLLLRQAVQDFSADKYDAVIAMPFEAGDSLQKRYRGTFNMYREQGFQEIEKQDGVSVMLLDISK